MTALQKDIIYILLKDGTISGNATYGYRLKDKAGNPLLKFSHRTFYILKPYLRSNSRHQFVLNKMYVRSLSKKFWVKKTYLQELHNIKLIHS